MKIIIKPSQILSSIVIAIAAHSQSVAQQYRPPPPPKYKVDRRGSGDLYTTGSLVRVYDAPKAGAKLIDTYKPGAIMVLLGTAVGTPYFWVSPCNACDKGYALKSEFLRGSVK